MKPTEAKTIANAVYSRVLMTENTYNEFVNWLISGNADEDLEDREYNLMKGNSVKSVKDFSMDMWVKFC